MGASDVAAGRTASLPSGAEPCSAPWHPSDAFQMHFTTLGYRNTTGSMKGADWDFCVVVPQTKGDDRWLMKPFCGKFRITRSPAWPGRSSGRPICILKGRNCARGAVIAAHPPRKGITLRRNTIMVFADDAPMFNWGHPCRYLLYDAKTGEPYDEVADEFPPYLVNTPQSFVGFHLPVRVDGIETLWPIKPLLRCPYKFPAGQRYAILYGGIEQPAHQ